jgi:hypothetical protein
MGASGFRIIATKHGSLQANQNLLDEDFELGDDSPDNLMRFIHLSMSLPDDTVVNIIKNNAAYPLNNGNTVVGEIYRSFPINKGMTLNIQVGTPRS